LNVSVHFSDKDSSLFGSSNSCSGSELVELQNEFLSRTSNVKDCLLPQSGPTKAKRAKKSPRLSAVLDKCKINDRDCVYLLTAVLDTTSVDPSDIIINRTSIKSAREKYRQHIFNEMKNKFDHLDLKSLVLYWDSKFLPDITGKYKVDRFPIIVTAPNVEQLLGVPQLDSGTEHDISTAIYDTLEEWSLLEKIKAFEFDITASNSGRLNGACHLLEIKFNHDILYLACRHHMHEIVLQGVFTEVKLVTSSGPNIQIFKNFQKEWKI
jgi:hypothetical protein